MALQHACEVRTFGMEATCALSDDQMSLQACSVCDFFGEVMTRRLETNCLLDEWNAVERFGIKIYASTGLVGTTCTSASGGQGEDEVWNPFGR